MSYTGKVNKPVNNTEWQAKLARVFLGLGSNLGDREAHLRAALRALAPAVTIETVSSIYETEPVGYLDQPRFLNAVCSGTTGLPPLALLRAIKQLEHDLGRVPTVRFGPRVIDIDILFYDHLVLDTPELQVPHPRLAERAFVLLPLAEIAPDWRHPLTRQTARQMAAQVGQAGAWRLKPLAGNGCA